MLTSILSLNSYQIVWWLYLWNEEFLRLDGPSTKPFLTAGCRKVCLKHVTKEIYNVVNIQSIDTTLRNIRLEIIKLFFVNLGAMRVKIHNFIPVN